MRRRYATREQRQFCFFATKVGLDPCLRSLRSDWSQDVIFADPSDLPKPAKKGYIGIYSLYSQRVRYLRGTRMLHGLLMTGPKRGERLQIMLTPEELTLLDDFRYEKRMPSRTAAVRELLKRGLAAEGFKAAAFGARSEDYGVGGADPTGRKGR